ncbi:MAG: helix-turn-helix transcriptional regulator, partial [Candidatus Eisenbacteria bacterium]|nr:helix-turn-helix transcriptional regulator [Candidatus Eisenbacteria bacterium]
AQPGLKRLCLLGHEKTTISALGRLLGKTFYLEVPASLSDCLGLLCTRGRVHAFVVDPDSCQDVVTLLDFLSDRQLTVPTFLFTASDDFHLMAHIVRLGVRPVYRKPADIWKLSESIQAELGEPGSGVQPRTRMATRDVLAAAIDFILERPHSVRTAVDVSRHVNVSREHLTRQFTKYTGCTLWDFVTACRIDRAKDLLRGLDLPVKEVASRVGYTCQSSFFRAFAGRTGLTPNEYRRAACQRVTYRT